MIVSAEVCILIFCLAISSIIGAENFTMQDSSQAYAPSENLDTPLLTKALMSALKCCQLVL